MPEAIIVGGGLAGRATALALARAGIGSTVYEAGSASADDLGAWLTLASNGMDALDTLGLADAVADEGFATPRMALRTSSGRELVSFPSGTDRPDGLQVQTIRRADLYRVLREECDRRGVPTVYGARLADAFPLPGGGVRARFTDGSEATGELLVGADGLRSRTRTVIDPAATAARYTGLLNVGGYACGVDLGRPPACSTSASVAGASSDTSRVPTATCGGSPTRRAPSRSVVSWPPCPRTTGAGGCWTSSATTTSPSAGLLEASDTLFTGWPTYDIPTVRTWHRDGMVLVGDAVHAASPASGQGASMAFEDAVTLARCLRDRPVPSEAFAAYERLRRTRVEAVVARGKRSGDAKAPGPVGRWCATGSSCPWSRRACAGPVRAGTPGSPGTTSTGTAPSRPEPGRGGKGDLAGCPRGQAQHRPDRTHPR